MSESDEEGYSLESSSSQQSSKSMMSVLSGLSGISWDPTTKKLEKHDLTEKFKRQKHMSDAELMQECAKEWQDSEDIAWYCWNGAKERLAIKTKNDNLSTKEKENILQLILSCTDLRELIIKKKVIKMWENEDPLQWIERWKKEKGITIKTTTFLPQKGLTLFQETMTDNQIILKDLNSQVHDALPEDIIAPSKGYIASIKELFDKEQYEKNIFKTMGEVVIEQPKDVMEDLEKTMKSLTISKKGTLQKNKKRYDVDNLIEDIQDKLLTRLTIYEENEIKKIIERNTKDKNNSVDVNTLMSTVKKVGTKAAITEAKKISDTGRIGTVSEKGVSGSQYHKNVKFIEPYRDPHFTFLGSEIEYWVPKLHMKTGLPVFSEKSEILKNVKKGTKVYIKLQNVNVFVPKTQKSINVYYFRKFIDFNDFLKQWQETYVRQYYELGNELLDMLSKGITISVLNRVKNSVIRRQYLRYKIKDIQMYFFKVAKETKSSDEEIKLYSYASDKIVQLLLDDTSPESEKDVYDVLSTVPDIDKKRKNDKIQRYLFDVLRTITEFFPAMQLKEIGTKKQRNKF